MRVWHKLSVQGWYGCYIGPELSVCAKPLWSPSIELAHPNVLSVRLNFVRTPNLVFRPLMANNLGKKAEIWLFGPKYQL